MHCPSLFELPKPSDGLTGWPWTAEGEQLPALRFDGKPWPKMTVVTPSFNQVEYIEATIRSVLLQGYPNLEYIIMDGGSTDGSQDIIRKYEPWLARWESGPDGGQYSAIQKGFSYCGGEIMAWLNSDDEYFPWTLHVVAEIFLTFPHVRWLSTTSLCTIGPQGGLFDIGRMPGYTRLAFFSQSLKREPVIIQQESTFWRRDLWDQSGAYLAGDLHYAGDFELWARFWQFEELVTTPTPLAVFRIHERQKTSNLDDYFEEAQMVLNKYRRPFPTLVAFLFPLIALLKRFNPSRNWMDAGSRMVYLDHQKGGWFEIRFFSFREAIRPLFLTLKDFLQKITHPAAD